MTHQIFAPPCMLLLLVVTSATGHGVKNVGISMLSSVTTQCLEYEPKVVSLSGVIVRQTYPGPPNFESVAEGDEPRTIWVLKVKKTICVLASDGVNVKEDNEKEIQLVLSDEQYKQYRSLLGRRVAVSGKLFHASTGYHYKNLLLTTDRIQRRTGT